jgi:SanA protein
MKTFLRVFLIFGCLAFFITGGLRLAMIFGTKNQIFTLENVPAKRVVLVPGAGLNARGEPSAALQDRLDAAIALYESGKVEKLLLTGDNSSIHYNEPGAMQAYALSQGIPEADLVLDYAGRRTYDSCYRAKYIFGLEEVIVVTQAYHLPRTIFLCKNSGLETVGVPVEQSQYIRARYLFWNLREVFASAAAWTDILIRKPLPILGDPEPIFP